MMRAARLGPGAGGHGQDADHGVGLLIGLVGVLLPLLAALGIAHWQILEQESRLGRALATEVLRRSDAAADQAAAANQRLLALAPAQRCSEEGLALMRDLAMSASYVQTVGQVVDGRLLCSSRGLHGSGIELGPVESVGNRGGLLRSAVDLGLGDGSRFLVIERDGIAIAMHPEVVVDIFVDQPDVALGVFAAGSGRRLAGRGYFDPGWPAQLAGKAPHFDGRHLVLPAASASYDIVAFAALPATYLRDRLYALVTVLVPLALLFGALLSFGIVRLARQRSSLPAELRAALRRGEFVLHYQPIVATHRRGGGAVALARGRRRHRGATGRVHSGRRGCRDHRSVHRLRDRPGRARPAADHRHRSRLLRQHQPGVQRRTSSGSPKRCSCG